MAVVGTRYARLVITAVVGTNERGQRLVRVLCDCGVTKRIALSALKKRLGATQSCGCLMRERVGAANRTHGMSKRPEHRVWWGMVERCENPANDDFADYGGRGIKVCTRWRKSFAAFLSDMGPRPDKGYMLDRVNNNGDYKPSNVRWTNSIHEQLRNRRNTRWLHHQGRRLTISEWARELGIGRKTIHERLRRGWSVARALGWQGTIEWPS